MVESLGGIESLICYFVIMIYVVVFVEVKVKLGIDDGLV